jgi:hypothetical protein
VLPVSGRLTTAQFGCFPGAALVADICGLRRQCWPSTIACTTTLRPAYHLSDGGCYAIDERLLKFCAKHLTKVPLRVLLKVEPAGGNVVISLEVEARLRLALLSGQIDSLGSMPRYHQLK